MNKNPNLLLMSYDNRWLVNKLVLIPSFFFSQSVIEKRKPLSPTARRAGWVGCNILLSNIPSVGKIPVVVDGRVTEPAEVRTRYALVRPFANLNIRARGWTLDLLRIVERLPVSFMLNDVYIWEREIASLHPNNKNVRAKIRQQLKILRDMGIISFLGAGRYMKQDSPRGTSAGNGPTS